MDRDDFIENTDIVWPHMCAVYALAKTNKLGNGVTHELGPSSHTQVTT